MTEFQNTTYGARTGCPYQSYGSLKSSAQLSGKAPQASFSGQVDAHIRLGYIYYSVDLVSGQELYMNYDESSSENDPVMLAEGLDIHGNAFQTKIHLNEIDVNHASIVEMTALNVHLAKQGDQAVKNHFSFPLRTLSARCDLNKKMDFEQYFSNITENYQAAGFKENADRYKNELEGYLAFQNMGKLRVKTKDEHVLFRSEKEKTGVFSEKTLAELAGFNLDCEIDWESDGTGNLTEDQIQYMKDYREALRKAAFASEKMSGSQGG